MLMHCWNGWQSYDSRKSTDTYFYRVVEQRVLRVIAPVFKALDDLIEFAGSSYRDMRRSFE